MAAKDVRFGGEARRTNAAWHRHARRSSKGHLGPKGRNVILDKRRRAEDYQGWRHRCQRDRTFRQVREHGAQMVREVASKTNDIAGDGTTTAIVLAQAIVREGAKAVSAGMNPMDLKRGIDKAVIALVDELKKRSKKVTTPARDRTGWCDCRERRDGDRQDDRRGNAEGRQRRRDHGRGKPSCSPNRARRGSKACSSIAATCRLTSSPTLKHWSLSRTGLTP